MLWQLSENQHLAKNLRLRDAGMCCTIPPPSCARYAGPTHPCPGSLTHQCHCAKAAAWTWEGGATGVASATGYMFMIWLGQGGSLCCPQGPRQQLWQPLPWASSCTPLSCGCHVSTLFFLIFPIPHRCLLAFLASVCPGNPIPTITHSFPVPMAFKG
jgi:hypothetical protein